MHGWWDAAAAIVTAVGLKIIGAIVLYFIGRKLISVSVGLLSRLLSARSFDAALQRYIVNILSVGLNIVLVVAILGYSGWRQPALRRCWPALALRSVRPGRGCWLILLPAPS
jgi:small-conductance mechanosensitive channel